MIFIDFNLYFIARFFERGSPRFLTKEFDKGKSKAADGVQILRRFTHQRDSSSRRKKI